MILSQPRLRFCMAVRQRHQTGVLIRPAFVWCAALAATHVLFRVAKQATTCGQRAAIAATAALTATAAAATMCLTSSKGTQAGHNACAIQCIAFSRQLQAINLLPLGCCHTLTECAELALSERAPRLHVCRLGHGQRVDAAAIASRDSAPAGSGSGVAGATPPRWRGTCRAREQRVCGRLCVACVVLCFWMSNHLSNAVVAMPLAAQVTTTGRAAACAASVPWAWRTGSCAAETWVVTCRRRRNRHAACCSVCTV